MSTLDAVREKIKSHFPKDSTPLDFERVSAEALKCRCCGQFIVGRSRVNDIPQYSVWFKAKDRGAQCLRQNLPSAEDAKCWASSLARAYRAGRVSLDAPLTKIEIERLRSAGANSVA